MARTRGNRSGSPAAAQSAPRRSNAQPDTASGSTRPSTIRRGSTSRRANRRANRPADSTAEPNTTGQTNSSSSARVSLQRRQADSRLRRRNAGEEPAAAMPNAVPEPAPDPPTKKQHMTRAAKKAEEAAKKAAEEAKGAVPDDAPKTRGAAKAKAAKDDTKPAAKAKAAKDDTKPAAKAKAAKDDTKPAAKAKPVPSMEDTTPVAAKEQEPALVDEPIVPVPNEKAPQLSDEVPEEPVVAVPNRIAAARDPEEDADVPEDLVDVPEEPADVPEEDVYEFDPDGPTWEEVIEALSDCHSDSKWLRPATWKKVINACSKDSVVDPELVESFQEMAKNEGMEEFFIRTDFVQAKRDFEEKFDADDYMLQRYDMLQYLGRYRKVDKKDKKVEKHDTQHYKYFSAIEGLDTLSPGEKRGKTKEEQQELLQGKHMEISAYAKVFLIIMREVALHFKFAGLVASTFISSGLLSDSYEDIFGIEKATKNSGSLGSRIESQHFQRLFQRLGMVEPETENEEPVRPQRIEEITKQYIYAFVKFEVEFKGKCVRLLLCQILGNSCAEPALKRAYKFLHFVASKYPENDTDSQAFKILHGHRIWAVQTAFGLGNEYIDGPPLSSEETTKAKVAFNACKAILQEYGDKFHKFHRDLKAFSSLIYGWYTDPRVVIDAKELPGIDFALSFYEKTPLEAVDMVKKSDDKFPEERFCVKVAAHQLKKVLSEHGFDLPVDVLASFLVKDECPEHTYDKMLGNEYVNKFLKPLKDETYKHEETGEILPVFSPRAQEALSKHYVKPDKGDRDAMAVAGYGTRHNKIRFLDYIGSGNFGIVFKVIHADTLEVMVLKLEWIPWDYFDEGFLRSTWAHSSVSHLPNVVDLKGVMFPTKQVKGETQAEIQDMNYKVEQEETPRSGNHILVGTLQGFCNGDEFDKFVGSLTKEELDIHFICGIIEQLSSTVKIMSKMRFVHRDIKTQNIVFHNRKPKMVDFGLARDIVPGEMTAGVGTKQFMAKKVLAGEYDASTEMCGVGKTMAKCTPIMTFLKEGAGNDEACEKVLDLIGKMENEDHPMYAKDCHLTIKRIQRELLG